MTILMCKRILLKEDPPATRESGYSTRIPTPLAPAQFGRSHLSVFDGNEMLRGHKAYLKAPSNKILDSMEIPAYP